MQDAMDRRKWRKPEDVARKYHVIAALPNRPIGGKNGVPFSATTRPMYTSLAVMVRKKRNQTYLLYGRQTARHLICVTKLHHIPTSWQRSHGGGILRPGRLQREKIIINQERKFRNSIPCTTPQSLADDRCSSAMQ